MKNLLKLILCLFIGVTVLSCEFKDEDVVRVEVGQELRMLLEQYRNEGRVEYQRLEQLLLDAEIDRDVKLQIMLNVFNGRFDDAFALLNNIKGNTDLAPFIRDAIVGMRAEFGAYRVEAINLLLEIRAQNQAMKSSIDSGIAQILASNLQILQQGANGQAEARNFWNQTIALLNQHGITLQTLVTNSNLALADLAIIRQFVILNNTGINNANATLATLDIKMGILMADFNNFRTQYANNWQQTTTWFGQLIASGNLTNSGIANLTDIVIRNFAISFANDQALLLGQQSGEAAAIARHNAVMNVLAQHGQSLAQILAITTSHAADFKTFVTLYGQDRVNVINHITAIGIGVKADIQAGTNTIMTAINNLPSKFTSILQNAMITWTNQYNDLRNLLLEIQRCPCPNCGTTIVNNNYVSSTYVVNEVVSNIYNIDNSVHQQNAIENTFNICNNSGDIDIDVCAVMTNLSNVNNSGTLQIGNGNVTNNNRRCNETRQKNGCRP